MLNRRRRHRTNTPDDHDDIVVNRIRGLMSVSHELQHPVDVADIRRRLNGGRTEPLASRL